MRNRVNGHSRIKSYRNVDMDPAWKLFEIFLADMGEPGPHDTLDRIDNERGYWPDNCRWATMTTQERNRTNNRMVTYKDKTLCVAEWAEILRIPYFTLYSRLRNNNWNMKLTLAIHAPNSLAASTPDKTALA